ncbi:MAG TPA: hypothetical protein VFJ97_14370 [Dermatophilaceae bacterium]|nr:hypothetical protein [Dermatophilaceae bacterium]
MPGNTAVLTRAAATNKANIARLSNGGLMEFMLCGGGDYLFVGDGHNGSDMAAVYNPNQVGNYYGWLQVERKSGLLTSKLKALHFPKGMTLLHFPPSLTEPIGVKNEDVEFDMPGGTRTLDDPAVPTQDGACGFPVTPMPPIQTCPVDPDD